MLTLLPLPKGFPQKWHPDIENQGRAFLTRAYVTSKCEGYGDDLCCVYDENQGSLNDEMTAEDDQLIRHITELLAAAPEAIRHLRDVMAAYLALSSEPAEEAIAEAATFYNQLMEQLKIVPPAQRVFVLTFERADWDELESLDERFGPGVPQTRETWEKMAYMLLGKSFRIDAGDFDDEHNRDEVPGWSVQLRHIANTILEQIKDQ